MVQVCDSYILLYLWRVHNMWDRLLIKCNWLLSLERKKQISLWQVYLYKVQTKLVQHIPLDTSSPPNYFGKGKKKKEKKKGKEMCNLFCACLYFEEHIL